jgi:hypothetical protein
MAKVSAVFVVMLAVLWPSRPAKITGKNVGPILFKNVKLNGTVVKSVDQLTKAGWDISVPMQFQ